MTVPAHGDGTTAPTESADPVADLRGAVDALPATNSLDDADAAFDAAQHAARFEAVHDALVAVLADVDRT